MWDSFEDELTEGNTIKLGDESRDLRLIMAKRPLAPRHLPCELEATRRSQLEIIVQSDIFTRASQMFQDKDKRLIDGYTNKGTMWLGDDDDVVGSMVVLLAIVHGRPPHLVPPTVSTEEFRSLLEHAE